MHPDLAVANALAEQGPGEALAHLERAAAVESRDMLHWQRILDVAVRLGDDDLALQAARRVVACNPRDPRYRAILADRLIETGEVREALAITTRLFDEDPRSASLPLAIGIQLARLGREDEAIRSVRLALRRDPQSALAWENLANLKVFRPGAPELEELEQLARLSADRAETAGLAYALAKAYDDIGDVDRAFEWFSRGSRRVVGMGQPRTASFFKEAADVCAAFPPEVMQAGSATGRTERPIFVIGCPRSGTTLLEQILTTAPGSFSSGENKMARLACLGFALPSPASVAQFLRISGSAQSAWNRVAETYVSRLRTRFGAADAVVDKSLVNYLYVGALALALPNARIIHVRRDPMDVAWSCFRRRFHEGLYWSYHFESIAAFLRAYEDIMSYWKRVQPDRILTVDFERLVTDPEIETSRVFAHAGLERPADWRLFHRRKGVVQTASQLQVRRPLSAASMGAWRRYERHLGPLIDAMGRHGFQVERQA